MKSPKIAKAQGRDVKEWIGKNANSVPPPTVLQRIYDRAHGICHITGLPIGKKAWDADHVKALEDGGENREANLAPALRTAHRKKTAEENVRRKEADRKRRSDIGAKAPPPRPLQGRGFPETAKPLKAPPKVAQGETNIQRRFR